MPKEKHRFLDQSDLNKHIPQAYAEKIDYKIKVIPYICLLPSQQVDREEDQQY